MNEIYWMTVIGNLSTALTVVWIVAFFDNYRCHAACFVGIGR